MVRPRCGDIGDGGKGGDVGREVIERGVGGVGRGREGRKRLAGTKVEKRSASITRYNDGLDSFVTFERATRLMKSPKSMNLIKSKELRRLRDLMG